jgi:hypothetical protein
MHVKHSRLLILLVLVPVVSVAFVSVGHASLSTGNVQFPDLTWTPQTRPDVTPTSGEPDVGQTPRPVSHASVRSPGSRREGESSPRVRTDFWFHWIVRTWMVRWFGAR